MAKTTVRTGADPTALVAIEQNFQKNQRIIEDNLAYYMLPSGKAFVWLTRFKPIRDWMVRITEKTFPGLWGCMMCRKRYIDERIADSVNMMEAVVNLGAGFDTRAIRLPQLSHIPVWELDEPANIKLKELQIRTLFGEVPANVTLVEIDFNKDDLGSRLLSNGYTTDKRTFFIWEAVTQYLTEEGVRAVFEFLAKAESGSRITFTYVLRDFIDGGERYGWDTLYKDFVETKVWIFGMDPEAWPDFLKQYGWQLVEDISYSEMAEKYVMSTGRILTSTPVERMAYAEKM